MIGDSSSVLKCCCEPLENDCPDFQVNHINEMAIAESMGNFWFLARFEFIKDAFIKYVSKSNRVLDIGSGSGGIASSLISMGFSVAVGDVHPKSLELARKAGVQECSLINLYDPLFTDEFDVICLFDVIEHLEDDEKALYNVSCMLKTGGKVVITVPAHQWLWNGHDKISGHKRRYTNYILQQKVNKAGFRVIKSYYIFRLILPLLLFRRLTGNI